MHGTRPDTPPPPVIAIFVVTGNIDWVTAVVLSAGMALGAWWSAHLSVKGGERVVKHVRE